MEEKISKAKFVPKKIAQLCPVCNGFGSLRFGTKICQACKGLGYVLVPAIDTSKKFSLSSYRTT